MPKPGRKTKYTDDYCRELVRLTRERFGVKPFTAAEWMAEFHASAYGLERVRAYGETHGAPFYPVRYEGLIVGRKGDEAELIKYRETAAHELIERAADKLEIAKSLDWCGAKIAPRLTDGKETVRLASSLSRKLTRLLTAGTA